MLSAELELAHLDARHWTAWWNLVVPPRVRARPAWALVIVERDQLLKVIVTGKGSIDPATAPLAGTDGATLAAYARTLGVTAVVVVERGLVAQLAAEIEGGLTMSMDLVEQALVALRAVKRHAGRGLWTEPALLEILPTPGYEPLQKTFDLLVPDRSALLAYVIDDDRARIHASIIGTKQAGDITRAATHRAIADLVSETALARDWEKQHKRVLAAVEERYAKPSLGIFLERATLMRVITGPSDQLAREINAKRIIIDPAPTWLLGLLGGATVAAMAGRAASAFASLLSQSTRDRASAFATRAKGALMDSGAHPFALLGFDPLELWARLKHFYRDE